MQLDPEILEATFTNEGDDIKTLSEKQPILLVFLRHFGCTFCREAMSDIAAIQHKIVEAGLKPVIVHMATEEIANEYFQKYKLTGITNISDPDLSLYEYFGLFKGTFGQLYGLKTWIRGIKVGLIDGHGAPIIDDKLGDYSRMPGIFILKDGKVATAFVHKSAADRPDYMGLIQQFLKS